MLIKVKGGTPRFARPDSSEMTARLRETHPTLAKITQDKVMYKAITQGNASDSFLTRDCEAIEREKMERKKNDWKEKKLKKIKEMRSRYKARYGYDPL